MSEVFRRLAAAPRTRAEALRPSPVFVLVVVLAVAGGVVAQGAVVDRSTRFGVFALVAAGWVVSLCLHEFAHALAAHRAGDTDVLSAGYLTLNPLRYAHPVLSLVLPVVFIALGGIGLPGGAVLLHRHRFRSRAWASAVALLGPAVNVVLGVLLLVAAQRLGAGVVVGPGLVDGSRPALATGLAFLGFLQVTAAVLNLLPVPGLDGWAALEPYLAPSTARAAEAVKPYGMLGLIAVLFVPGVNRAFFTLVDALVGATGVDTTLVAVGRQLFRFWTAF